MHKRVFCQKLLNNALGNSIHKARETCLTRFISDLLDYDTQLSVTEIGKKLSSQASVKSKIKAANYFINNYKLSEDIAVIYRGLAHFFWGQSKELVILIDWTGACSNGYHTLQASIVGHGRSIPVYHEVHSEMMQEKAEVHDQFLLKLSEIIPKHIAVTIITDAGFHRIWFAKVAELGWNFVGRVYSKYYYQCEGTSAWSSVRNIPFAKTGKALALGKVRLGKTRQPLDGYLYSYKERLSGRVRTTRNRYPSHDKAHSDFYKNGWVIFSSLDKPAPLLIRYYKKRMQIEQNFKDIKNERLGFGLRCNLSTGKLRINMLYFLACLITIICWWFGLMMETSNQHRKYQANSIKNKRVRSFIHLARLGFRHQPELFEWLSFKQIIDELQRQYHQFIDTGIIN